MFYKGMRIHYKIPQTHYSRLSSFIVSVDRGNKRFFLEFASSDEFEQWYTMLAPEEKTMNEVIMSDNRKLIIDIDDPEDSELANILSFYDFKLHLTSRIRDVFMALGIGNPHIIIYDICSNSKISYHAVVANFTFSAKTCKGLCMIIASNQIWDRCVDVGVYKTVQSVRIEGSTKYGEHRWKNRTNNHNLSFASGLLSDNKNTTESSFTCNIFTSNTLWKQKQHTSSVHSDTECPSMSCSSHIGLRQIDFSQFKIGKFKNNILPLYRIKPGFCIQCNRIHNRENAAVKYGYNGSPVYICWRKYASE